MVGLLIVGKGVPVRGIIGTGHPTTRQTQTQPGPVVPAGQAVQTAGRVRLNLVGGGDMPTPAPVGTACDHVGEFAASCPLPAVHLRARWTPRVNRADQSGEMTETSKTHHQGR